MTVNNRTVNPDFEYWGTEGLKALVEAMDRGVDATEKLGNSAWQQAVAGYAAEGFDTDTDEFPNLAKWEVKVRTEFGVESKRSGGGRSKGTGYIMPKTPKTYKHFMKAAVQSGVELLDSDGNPRDFANVKADLAAAKDPKSAEERIMNTLTAYCKLREACADHDARVVDADHYLVDWLRNRGYTVALAGAAAA